jgi:hypothetical protein
MSSLSVSLALSLSLISLSLSLSLCLYLCVFFRWLALWFGSISRIHLVLILFLGFYDDLRLIFIVHLYIL